jgi:hypothetical protein
VSAVVVLILRILIAACLFAFAGYAFYLLWKTLRQAVGGSSGAAPLLILRPVDKPERDALHIEAGEIEVGREKTCGLCLADKSISNRHALLSYHNKQWWVKDLGSTNGTYMNDMAVTTPTVLVTGDTLTFGKLDFTVGFRSTPPTQSSRK